MRVSVTIRDRPSVEAARKISRTSANHVGTTGLLSAAEQSAHFTTALSKKSQLLRGSRDQPLLVVKSSVEDLEPVMKAISLHKSPQEDDPSLHLSPISETPKKLSTVDIDDDASVVTNMSSKFKASPMRWLALVLFCMLSLTNAFQWICFATIRQLAADVYGVPPTDIDQMSIIFMVVYVPLLFLAPWIIQKYSLRTTLLLSGGFNFLGALFRALACIPTLSGAAGAHGNYGVAIIGQILAAIAQAMFLAVPPELSMIWFPTSERGLATGVAVQANALGAGLGLVVSPAVATDAKSFSVYLFIVAAITGVTFLMKVFFLPPKPAHPPSLAAAKQDHEKLEVPSMKQMAIEGYQLCTTDFQFVCLTLAFGLSVGANFAWATFLEPIMFDAHPDDVQIGVVGFVGVGGSLVGNLAWPWIAAKTKQYKLSSWVIFGGIGGLICVFGALAANPNVSFAWINLEVFIMNLLVGGAFALMLEYAAELTFPVSESLSSGILTAASQIFGCLCIEILSLTDSDGANMSLTIGGMCVLAFFWSLPLQDRLKRTEFESKHAEDLKKQQHDEDKAVLMAIKAQLA